jgi:geranylgeranyl diphosphate synthase type I
MTTQVDAGSLLETARRSISPTLRQAVDTMPGPTRTVLGYHFGWWDREGVSTDRPSGKFLRAALTLASAEAVGAVSGEVVGCAAAVELIHNFSLLHDDVMDGDEMRRGRPAAWNVFGIARAVLAGDALLVLAFRQLREAGGDKWFAVGLAELSATLLELLAGQCADLAFESRQDVDLTECLAMAGGKTGSLMAAACALGAMAGGASDKQTAALREFGLHLGIAFQLLDDLLGIGGEAKRTGKPVGADLVRRKKSLPVVAAIAGGTEAGRSLAVMMSSTTALDQDDVARAGSMVARAGGLTWARAEARSRRKRALDALDGIGLRPSAVAALVALAQLATERDR